MIGPLGHRGQSPKTEKRALGEITQSSSSMFEITQRRRRVATTGAGIGS